MAKFTKDDFGTPEFFKAIKDLREDFKGLAKDSRDVSKAMKETKSFTEYQKKVKEAADATKKLTDSEKKLVAATKRLKFEQSDAGKERAKLSEQTRRQTKANREYAKSQLTAVKSTNRWGAALRSFQFKFNALGNLIAQATATIFRAFIRVIKQSVDVVKNFDKASARLASVVGKTRKEIADLTKQAEQLGKVTQFTATQVTSLQIELAKLGFEANEIKAATPGILSFATATGANLAEAAKTAGAAVRVFGLNASETEEAVATLAVATTKSGLTFEAFDTILSTVGPVAKAYGFTLEDVVALTGELATAGFEANKAATATRNILLNLADANGALAKSLGGSVTTFDDLIDGLVTLDAKGIDLGTTLELTDKRSVAAFSRFLEGAESARELRDGIIDVTDELQAMVDVQLDTLAGDIDLLKSAWEGLILTFSSDGGILRTVIQFLTNAVLQVQNLDLAFTKFHKQNVEQLERSFTLLESLTNKQGAEFSKVTAAFADATVQELEDNRKNIIFHFSEIRKINKKEAAALFEELVRQRQSQADAEIQALIEKSDRLQEEEEKSNRKRVKTFADVSDALKQLKKDESETFEGEDQDYVAAYKDAWDVIEESTEGTIEKLEGLLQGRSDRELERLDEEQEKRDAIHDQQIADEEELREVRIQTANEVANFLGAVSDRRIANLEAEAEAGIISEEKLAEEKAKIQRRQAVLKKAEGLFNIAVDTASAITQALPNIPLSVAIGILGLAQAAVVIARPIPAFAKGVKSSPEGPAIVGEKGSELLIDKQGHIGLTPGKESLAYLEKGTQVVPADITSQLLRYTNVMQGAGTADDAIIVALMDRLDGSIHGLKREIRNKPAVSSILTPGGILTAVHKGNTTIKKLDKFFK